MSRSAYEITKLAFSDVVTYRRLIGEMRQTRKYRRMSYEHSRNVIGNYHRSDADVSILEKAIADLQKILEEEEAIRSQIEPINNKVVLESYLENFATPFRSMSGELPEEFSSFEISIDDLRITGKPHLQVANARGKSKYLYLLTAKDWTEDQKSFFISLLGEVVASNVEGVSPRDIEGLDCRTGNRITRNGLGTNYKNRLEYLAEDLKRLELN